MVTHDLDSLYTICDRIAALADGKVIAAGPMSTMLASEHPWLKAYFHGQRGRAMGSVGAVGAAAAARPVPALGAAGAA
jgi:phospholipid/cholesterol/gamma-HCH transport system ATP-binding protein